MSLPTLKAINLGKSFKKDGLHTELFSDLSFSLYPGEVIGLVGNNGSGKSTLLKIIAGIIKPSSGRVELYGKLNSVLDLGQNFSPDLTGLENLKINLRNQDLSAEAVSQKINEIIVIADIGDYIREPVKNYSSGMLLRIGFALYTSIPCDILIIDEIISVGDMAFRAKCEEIIADLIKKGTTVVLATHDLDTIRLLCHKCLLLHKGNSLWGSTNNVLPFYIENSKQNNLNAESFEKEKETYSYLSSLDQKVELVFVRLVLNKNKLSYADPITFEIQYKATEQLVMGVTLHLYYKNRVPLLSSCMNYDNSAKQSALHQKGVYTLTVTIPPHLLAPERYSIDLSFHNMQETDFRSYKSALTFVIEKDVVLQTVFDKALPPFPLLPRLNWKLEEQSVRITRILKDELLLEKLYEDGIVKLPAVPEAIVQKLRELFFLRYPDSENAKENIISIIDPKQDVRAACHYEIMACLTPYLNTYLKDYKAPIATYFAKPHNENASVDLHQDHTLTDPEKDDDFTLWIPLQDVQEGEGEMVVLPHSHQLYNKINLYTYQPSYLSQIQDEDCLSFPCQAGEGLLLFNRAIHGSRRNIGGKLRVAVSLKICHKDASVYSYFKVADKELVERFRQADDYYVSPEWDEKQRPADALYDKTVNLY